jgi:hypothetical protein
MVGVAVVREQEEKNEGRMARKGAKKQRPDFFSQNILG